ncbi:hybrid sensor histidine kinase/response regulator [Roseivirga spongicola]|nr:ATP-binding protein [Roseivirga spongicola]WPZ11444.1 ATP-binding protein [Roseivirga spongicola]
MNIINRRTLAWTINLALPITTIIIMIMGYKAYSKLDQMVDELGESAQPNYNLIVLNEVSFYIDEMEKDIDTYRTDPKPGLLKSFNNALDESLFLIDSLKQNIEDERVKNLYDSLSSLVNQWAKVQTQIGAINSDILESTLDDLAEKIESIPQTIEEDTIEEEPKKGFFGKLLSRKKKDTTQVPKESSRIRQEILDELVQARTASEKQDKEIKRKLSSLNEEAAELQDEIVYLINELQLIELDNDNQKVAKAEVMAKDTNQEIVVFSTLTSLLLVITIITQVNYLARNKKYQNALRSAKRNAEDLAHAKERFLANMSHEIRTPMNAIAGFTNQLLKSDMSPEQKDQLEVVKNSSDHLIHLLNDILDLSKLQANKVTLEKEIFDVKSTLFEVIRIFEDKASAKGIKLKTEFESVPKYVNGDPHRLRQMMTNLVSNAIKYTDEGSITLSASIHEKSGKDVTLRLAVKDTGLGIAKEKQKKIFEEFEQANSSDQRQGTGLGLAITNMLTNLHKGTIEMESEEGVGTEISLYIPYQIGKLDKTVDNNKPEEEIKLSDLKILIADDEPFNLKLLEAVFKHHEVELISANDGTQALEALKNEKFDIAILDVKMPGYSGFEIVEKIRNNGSVNKKSPMMALTATISNYERELSKTSGFNHIMRKPFDEQEFLEVIETLTNPEGRDKSILNGNKSKKVNAENLYDLNTLKSIGDQDFVNEMVSTFKTSATKSLKNLRKATDLEIRTGIREEAHKMLPPARHLSAYVLVEAIEKLQSMAEKSSFEDIDRQINKVEEIYSLIKDDLDSKV